MTGHTLIIGECGRPPTTNKMRTLHFQQRAKVDADWRHAGFIAAKLCGLPKMSRVTVSVQGRYPDRRALPDCDAVHPALKAVLDGVVDAGCLPDDKPPFVHSITYVEPFVERDLPAALVVTITEASS